MKLVSFTLQIFCTLNRLSRQANFGNSNNNNNIIKECIEILEDKPTYVILFCVIYNEHTKFTFFI